MRQPNILILMADQLRKDALGCYANQYAKTPNLDKLARQSVQFDRCYVANPICMPNRHSLFSGRYPHNHGMWTNGLFLEDDGLNLPHALSQHGWQTANIGKMHFSPDGTPAQGFNPEAQERWASEDADYSFHGPYRGFDYVELTLGHARQRGHYRQWFLQNGGNDAMFLGENEYGAPQTMRMEIPAHLHSTAFVGERTCHWLEHLRDPARPFFLVASFPDPHHPFDAPREVAEGFSHDEVNMPIGGPEDLASRPSRYAAMYRGEWHRSGKVPKTTTPDGLNEMQTRERILSTNAMVSLIDRASGRILDTLEKLGLADNTIVLFTSDHGELLGDHGLWLKGPFFYEGLLNIPLLARIPGIPARKTDALASTVDVVPTLCALAGMEIPDCVDGVSLAPHIVDPMEQPRARCMVEYRNGFGSNDVAYRVLITQDMKYVHCQTGEHELTDLKNDPYEKQNVAGRAAYQGIENEMRRLLLDEMLASETKVPRQISFA